MIVNFVLFPLLLIFSNVNAVKMQRSILDDTLLRLTELTQPARNLMNATLSRIMAGWVDLILERARATMVDKGLNAIALPPEKVQFSETVLGIDWHGDASIYDGVLRGLQTIHRTGPVNTTIEPQSGDLISDVELGVDNTSISARATAKFMSMGPTANITGGFDRVRIKMAVRGNMNLSGLHTNLERFEISDLGKLSMEVKGLGGVMNFLVETIAETLGNDFRQELRQLLEVRVKEIVDDIVARPPSIPNILSQL